MTQLQDYIAKNPQQQFPAGREIPARRLQICRLALRRSDYRLPGLGKTIPEQSATRRSARASRRRLRRERPRIGRHPGLHSLLPDRDDRRSDELLALSREQAPPETGRMGQGRRALHRLRQGQAGSPDRRLRPLLDRQSESARGKNRRGEAARSRHDQEIHRRSERDAVEQLITQLAQLCVKKKKPAETATAAAAANPRRRPQPDGGRPGRGTRSPARLRRE